MYNVKNILGFLFLTYFIYFSFQSQPADEVKKPTGKPLPTTIEVRRKPKNQITNKNNRKEVEVVTIET